MKRRLLPIVILLLATCTVNAGEIFNINRNWKFFKTSERDALMVNLPHTWNSDALCGRREYYRGSGNYLKYIDIDPSWRHRRIFVKFYGANSVASLMINGRFVGEHRGGSNAFIFEITDYVDFNGKNLFWIIVNNGERIDVLPTAGTENSYGGLFRNAELIVTNANTIGMDRYASDGLMLRPSKVSASKAEGSVLVKLNSSVARQVKLDLQITDAGGNTVSSASVKPKAEKGVTDASIPFEIEAPVLWNGTLNPYLYNITVTLTDGSDVETVTVRSGFRYFSADVGTGFSLNGTSYPLRGVVLYRDRAIYGSVSSEIQLSEDLDLIQEMGANAVHVAGGTHAPEFYRMCDERGIVVVTEIPFTGAVTPDAKGFYNMPEFKENAKRQLSELIWQRCNNPSIIAWGVFNDPELRGDDPVPFIKELNGLAKSTDPYRLTAGRSNRDGNVNAITDLIIWNHSLGWREGNPSDIAIWRDQILGDKVWGKLKSAVSYSAGGSIAHQTEKLQKPKPHSNWHPENWHTHFHETYIQALDDTPQFWALFPGNMFDSGSANYLSGRGQGVNDYGLVSFDRQTKKDAFYAYKAKWNKEDMFVHIVGKRNDQRREKMQNIRVYSNCKDIILIVNGERLDTKSSETGVFIWNGVILKEGRNTIEAEVPSKAFSQEGATTGNETLPDSGDNSLNAAAAESGTPYATRLYDSMVITIAPQM